MGGAPNGHTSNHLEANLLIQAIQAVLLGKPWKCIAPPDKIIINLTKHHRLLVSEGVQLEVHYSLGWEELECE